MFGTQPLARTLAHQGDHEAALTNLDDARATQIEHGQMSEVVTTDLRRAEVMLLAGARRPDAVLQSGDRLARLQDAVLDEIETTFGSEIRSKGYKFNALILAIVKSEPFQKRRLLRPDSSQQQRDPRTARRTAPRSSPPPCLCPLLLPPPGNGCAAINAAAKMCRITIMTCLPREY